MHFQCVNIMTYKGGAIVINNKKTSALKETRIVLRMNETEKVEAEKKAAANGLTLSSYIRMLLKKNK